MNTRALLKILGPLALAAGLLLAPCLSAKDDIAPIVLDRSTLLQNLALEMGAHYGLTETLELDLIRPWTSPGADVVVSVTEYPSALAPSVLVRVRYSKGEKILRDDTLALRVQLWRDAMITRSPVEKGGTLALDALGVRRIDAMRDKDALPVTVIGQDYTYARQIPAGRPLTWRDVSRRALVRKGDFVEVSASEGMLNITMKALAMQDGGKGDLVRVRNVDSKREFTALVIADNRAEVRF